MELDVVNNVLWHGHLYLPYLSIFSCTSSAKRVSGHHRHQSATTITGDPFADWIQFQGRCTDPGHPHQQSSSYVESQVGGVNLCSQVCHGMAACVAFTIDAKENCLVTTSCTAHGEDDGTHRTYVKKNAPRGAVVAPEAPEDQHPARQRPRFKSDCSYCPPQNQCEQPRLCRAGKCFHGLSLKDGKACDDGDPVTMDDMCIKGRCVSYQDGPVVSKGIAHIAMQGRDICRARCALGLESICKKILPAID